MIKVTDIEQLSPEWFELRAGMPSASKFDKIITTKGAASKSRTNYMYTLAAERVLGKKEDSYINANMQRGIDLEPEAKSLFEMLHDIKIEKVGLCYKDEDKLFSCSPDGLGTETGLEIKCPIMSTHVSYLLANKLPADYFQQVQGSMYITGFSSWWFMSYYPGLKPLILEVERDDTFIGALEFELNMFCRELEITTNKIK